MVHNTFLANLKVEIQKAVPYAQVWLFGSRAYGTPTDESDWDILILTPEKVTAALKRSVHNVVFPVSLQLDAFVNTFIIQEKEWDTNPAYYSLHQTVDNRMIRL